MACCSAITITPRSPDLGLQFAKPKDNHKRRFLSFVRCSLVLDGSEKEKNADPSKCVVSQGEDSLEISRVVNGMWQLSSPSWGKYNPEKAVDCMFDHIDSGLTTFDMADIYGPAEQLFGAFMDKARRTKGEEYASKIVGLTKYVPRPERMTRQVVEQAINRSRKNMQVQSIDMVQFHWWDYEVDGYLDALKHLADLKEEGKIKTLGLTNFDTKRLQIILENRIPIVSNQVQHSLIDMRPQKVMREICQLTGVQLITYGTVLGGFLSEKYVDAKEPGSWGGVPISTPSQKKYKQMIDAWGGWRLFQDLIRELKLIAMKHSVSVSAVAVKAILDKPCVAASMVGVRFSQSEHIKDSVAVFSLSLDEEDNQRIESVLSKCNDLFDRIGDCGAEYR